VSANTPDYRFKLEEVQGSIGEAWTNSVQATREALDGGRDPAALFWEIFAAARFDMTHDRAATAFAYAMLRDAQAAQAATAGSPR
jgi:hypothetical protein